ncbi:molybdate ABC transporter substrate-binding protein [Thermostilla marina]
MVRKKRRTFTAWSVVCGSLCAAVLWSGCVGNKPSDAESKPLVVFAAASLTDVLAEIDRDFTATSGIPVELSTASSAALARQILQGAQPDVFLSANADWANRVAERFPDASPHPLLKNTLVVIVPQDAEFVPRSLSDLTDPRIGKLALADPEAAPAGIYAKQALENADVWNDVQEKVVSADDVRKALLFVATGAAEAGIVYASDALAEQSVRQAFAIDLALHDPIVYHCVVPDGETENPAAAEYVRFLQSEEARGIFERYGFLPLRAE